MIQVSCTLLLPDPAKPSVSPNHFALARSLSLFIAIVSKGETWNRELADSPYRSSSA
jgi:hypothetical protein